MSASSGIMLLLLLSPCSLLELAGCSMLERPFIFTCPLSCTPPFMFPIIATTLSIEPEDDSCTLLRFCMYRPEPGYLSTSAHMCIWTCQMHADHLYQFCSHALDSDIPGVMC